MYICIIMFLGPGVVIAEEVEVVIVVMVEEKEMQQALLCVSQDGI